MDNNQDFPFASNPDGTTGGRWNTYPTFVYRRTKDANGEPIEESGESELIFSGTLTQPWYIIREFNRRAERNGKPYRAVSVFKEFKVYWSGYERYDTAYILELDNGQKTIVQSESTGLETRQEWIDKVAEYKEALRETEEALAMADALE